MTITISATATGSTTPPQAEGISVVNGDFLITPNRYPDNGEFKKAVPTGDGIDEETCWMFYLDEDPNFSYFTFEGLTSALLTLTLTPKDSEQLKDKGKERGFGTDAFWIEKLEKIEMRELFDLDHELPSDVTTTITVELLNRKPSYTAEAILNLLFSNVSGRILMYYNDDAIISFAKLELTQ